MIDLIVNTVMIAGIVLVSVPTLLFAVLTVVNLAYGAYTLYIEQ